jgi:N-methylhydantoinase A
MLPLEMTSVSELEDIFLGMESASVTVLTGEGYSADALRIDRQLDLRYHGQGFEITIAVSPDFGEDDQALDAIRQSFESEHQRRYGHIDDRAEIEVVNARTVARIVGRARLDGTHARLLAARDAGEAKKRIRPQVQREAYFGSEHGSIVTECVERHDLELEMSGPLIIEEFDTTTVVPPDFSASLDEQLNIIIRRRERGT